MENAAGGFLAIFENNLSRHLSGYDMRLKETIEEITNLKQEGNRRSAADIHRLLDNHKALFIQHLEPEVYRQLLSAFESLGESSGQGSTFKREYESAVSLLSFYLDRIL